MLGARPSKPRGHGGTPSAEFAVRRARELSDADEDGMDAD